MADGVRALLRPVVRKWPKGQAVSGVTFGLEILGKGPGDLAKGEKKPAKLVLHGAFLAKARDESKEKPKFAPFATLTGTIQLKASKPVFTLDPKGKFEYAKPEPASGRFRRIRVAYEGPAFEGAPPAPAPAPDQQPAEPHPLTILRLPEEPKGMHFLVVGAALEIGGAKSSDIEQNDKLDVPLPAIELRIVKVDHHFAPSVESLAVTYKIGGLLGSRATLEVTSKNYAAGPIFKRELTEAELQDGLKVLEWNGKCNPASGDLKDRFLNPLFGPYELKISDGAKHEAKSEFRVLYHSLALKQGEWTPDGKEPPQATKKKEWAQYKLNDLGYYGGPVGHDFDDYLKKAVIRYKANHPKLHQLLHANYNDTITADMETALAAGDARRTYLKGTAFGSPTGSSQIFVEALTYEEKAGGASEFTEAKAPLEKQRLNRPLLPIVADILLLGKKGKGLAAPLGVGAVRVNWKFTDVQENLALQFTAAPGRPSRTRAYVELGLKLQGGRVGTVGDNCYKDFGGIRDAAASDFETPFLLGTSYEPFEAKKDGGQKVCFTKTHDDPATFPNRRGRTGIYLRPSNIAGDAYKLRAEIDFTGLPNAADLEKLHHAETAANRIHGETGTFQIWRRAKVALSLTWPARKNAHQWDEIRAEFAKAYVDLDVSTIDTQPIATYLSDAEYKTIVANNTVHAKPAVTLNADYLVGVALPAQGALNAAAYTTAIKTFTNANYLNLVYDDLRRQLSQNVRKKYPTGFVVMEFLTHKPIDIQTAPPANTTVTPANHNVVFWAFSIGLADSTIFADQKDPDHVYYVVSHEMGHNFWLKHWEHAGGSTPADHDTNDHNCSMSYSSNTCAHPHHKEGVYSPHFCGQCNLKLRGWDIDQAAIPANS